MEAHFWRDLNSKVDTFEYSQAFWTNLNKIYTVGGKEIKCLIVSWLSLSYFSFLCNLVLGSGDYKKRKHTGPAHTEQLHPKLVTGIQRGGNVAVKDHSSCSVCPFPSTCGWMWGRLALKREPFPFPSLRAIQAAANLRRDFGVDWSQSAPCKWSAAVPPA